MLFREKVLYCSFKFYPPLVFMSFLQFDPRFSKKEKKIGLPYVLVAMSSLEMTPVLMRPQT